MTNHNDTLKLTTAQITATQSPFKVKVCIRYRTSTEDSHINNDVRCEYGKEKLMSTEIREKRTPTSND